MLKPLLIWLVLSQGADITTTIVAIKSGCHEGNPLAKNHLGSTFVLKGGVSVGFSITLPILHKAKPKVANTIAASIATVTSSAAIWNTSKILQSCR